MGGGSAFNTPVEDAGSDGPQGWSPLGKSAIRGRIWSGARCSYGSGNRRYDRTGIDLSAWSGRTPASPAIGPDAASINKARMLWIGKPANRRTGVATARRSYPTLMLLS